MKRYLTCTLAALVPAIVSAQLHESIQVEGTMLRDIIPHQRLGSTPTVTPADIELKPLEFESKAIVTDYAPQLLTSPLTIWRGTPLPYDRPAYINIALANRWQTSLGAAWGFMHTESTRMSARVQFNSESIRQLQHKIYRNPTPQYADGTLGIDFCHDFKEAGRLSADVQWRSAWFNYYNLSPNPARPDCSPTQTLNQGNIRAHWSSTANKPMPWHASLAVTHTALRNLITDAATYNGQSETDLILNGGFNGRIIKNLSYGAEATLQIPFYSDGATTPTQFRADNYAIFSLAPFIAWNPDDITVKAGLNLDFTSGAGTESDRFNPVHISPAVNASWHNRHFAASLTLGGGITPNTLSRRFCQSLYLTPFITDTRPAYSPIDSRLELTAGPFAGFTASLSGAYKSLRGFAPSATYTYALLRNTEPINFHTSSAGWLFELRSEYSHTPWITARASIAYAPRSRTSGYIADPNADDRAKWRAEISATTTPVQPFDISVRWQFRAQREFLTGSRETIRANNWSDLGIRAQWRFSRNISANIYADNILCRRQELMPGLFSMRLTAGAGATFSF